MTDAQALALAVRAAAHWGGCLPEFGLPRLIKNRENAVFEVEFAKARAALRLHRPGYQSAAAIRSELWLTSELAQAGVAVPLPLLTQAGKMLVDLGDGRIASAILWADGAAIGQGGVPLAQPVARQVEIHRALGCLLAQMHDVADRLALPVGFVRPDWGLAGLLGETPFWGRFWEHPGLSASQGAVLRAARTHARHRLADYRGSQGLIHADAIRENILDHGTGLTLIDFDDCGFGYRLYDLGTALRDNLAEPALPALAAALLEGYGTLRPLEPQDRAMLPVFVLLRTLASVGWSMPRMAPDDPGAAVHIARALRAAGIVLAGGDLLA